MNTQSKFFWFVLVVLIQVSIFSPSYAQTDPPTIDGWVGLDSSTGHGWLAVRVDFPATMALSGVVWYNNDRNVVFPEITVSTGHEDGPGSLTESLSVHGPVSGLNSDFSEVIFDQPVASSLGGVYVIFEFPTGSQFSGIGEDGGAAFGCQETESDVSGWISGDGESWLNLDSGQHFAVVPHLIPFEEGMAVKSLNDAETPSQVVKAPYLKVGPNPFNPRTQLQFGLVTASIVSIKVFDIRGAKVATLVDQFFPSGRHSIFWQGKDGSGRQVACGSYFVRLKASDLVLTKRVLLLK